MAHSTVRGMQERVCSLILRSNTSTARPGNEGCSPAVTSRRCRYASDQHPYRAEDNSLSGGEPVTELDAREGVQFSSDIEKKKGPRDVAELMENGHARKIQEGSCSDVQKMLPFDTLKPHISSPTYNALTIKPFHHTFATPVQTAVLKLLPGLAEPYSDESRERKDMVVLSQKGTGKSLAFLVPVIEARQRAILMHGKLELAKRGLANNSGLERRINSVYTRTRVGSLILTTTKEEAMTIANEATLLSQNHHGMETRLLVEGFSKEFQLRNWMTGRRDIVVATPGRLRDLLTSEFAIREGFVYTQTVFLFSLSCIHPSQFLSSLSSTKSIRCSRMVFATILTP